MTGSTEGKTPCLFALALEVFERSQVLAGQCEFIVDNTLGERPHQQRVEAPSSVFDCLLLTEDALHRIHEEYDLIARHVVPSDQLRKDEPALRHNAVEPSAARCLPAPHMGRVDE